MLANEIMQYNHSVSGSGFDDKELLCRYKLKLMKIMSLLKHELYF